MSLTCKASISLSKIKADKPMWGRINTYCIHGTFADRDIEIQRETYDVGHFAGIIPINKTTRRITLVKQPRAAAMKVRSEQYTIEMCGGKTAREDPKEAVRRELEEECSLTVQAQDIRLLSEIMTNPGPLEEKSYLYYVEYNAAKDVENVINHDAFADEPLVAFTIAFESIAEYIASGKIYDARTLIAIYQLQDRGVLK